MIKAFNHFSFLPRLRPRHLEELDLAASLRAYQMIQRGDNDSPLQFTVKRYTKVMAHHKGKENRVRWFTVLGNVKGDGKRNCRDSFLFDSALNQRDGLMSYRSSGTQQCSLGAVRYDGVGDIFGKRPLEGRRIHLIPDERKTGSSGKSVGKKLR